MEAPSIAAQYLEIQGKDAPDLECAEGGTLPTPRDLYPYSPSSIPSPDGSLQSCDYQMSLPLPMDVAASLTYPLGILSATAMLLAERRNAVVRFHAWQSFLLSFVWLTVQVALAWLRPALLWPMAVAGLVGGIYLALWAYRTSPTLRVFYLPVIGMIASEFLYSEGSTP